LREADAVHPRLAGRKEIRMRKLRTLLALVGLLAVTVVPIGCRTVEGFGDDMQAGGRKLSGESREHRDY
jgi:predicted small secreted protein